MSNAEKSRKCQYELDCFELTEKDLGTVIFNSENEKVNLRGEFSVEGIEAILYSMQKVYIYEL